MRNLSLVGRPLRASLPTSLEAETTEFGDAKRTSTPLNGSSRLAESYLTLPRHSHKGVNEILLNTERAIRQLHKHSRQIQQKTIEAAKEAGREHERVYANNYVDLGKVDTVGFDFDYTLVTYSEELLDLIYDMALNRLVTSRQYPLEMLEKLVESCPVGLPKMHKDSSGRGLVSAHYKVGCVAHQDPNDPNHRRESFRMTMQRVVNAQHELQEDFEPPAPYLDWWGKLKFLIHIWGSHVKPSDNDSLNEGEEPLNEDDLLLHSALSNADVPPSLVQLLAMMFPHSTDLEHPKSNALPIHLACRLYRFRVLVLSP